MNAKAIIIMGGINDDVLINSQFYISPYCQTLPVKYVTGLLYSISISI
jgi:hypothetical protein